MRETSMLFGRAGYKHACASGAQIQLVWFLRYVDSSPRSSPVRLCSSGKAYPGARLHICLVGIPCGSLSSLCASVPFSWSSLAEVAKYAREVGKPLPVLCVTCVKECDGSAMRVWMTSQRLVSDAWSWHTVWVCGVQACLRQLSSNPTCLLF